MERNKDIDILRQCKAAIKNVADNCEVILYGSRARGDAREDSDYDILVLINGPVDMKLEDAIRSELYPLELETAAVITLLVYNREQWSGFPHRATPFYKNVEREGVLL
ncbi:MAG: nucleotidyltransferase domain-containing protein [Phycisphaerae bacterium]